MKTILIISIIVIIIYIIYYHSHSSENFKLLEETKFKNEFIEPSIEFIKKIYGSPSEENIKQGGYISWSNSEPFSELSVIDESIESSSPVKSCNFVKGTIKVYILPDTFNKILQLNESIYYDRIKSRLVARGDTLEDVSLILYNAVMINNNPEKFETIKEELDNSLKNKITKDKFDEIIVELKKLVKENYNRYSVLFPNDSCKL